MHFKKILKKNLKFFSDTKAKNCRFVFIEALLTNKYKKLKPKSIVIIKGVKLNSFHDEIYIM